MSFVALTLTRLIRHCHCLPSSRSVLPLHSYRDEFRPSQKWHAGSFGRKRETEAVLFKTRFSPLTDSFSRPLSPQCRSTLAATLCQAQVVARSAKFNTRKTINERRSSPSCHQEHTRGNSRVRMSMPQSNWARAPTYLTSIWHHGAHCR